MSINCSLLENTLPCNTLQYVRGVLWCQMFVCDSTVYLAFQTVIDTPSKVQHAKFDTSAILLESLQEKPIKWMKLMGNAQDQTISYHLCFLPDIVKAGKERGVEKYMLQAVWTIKSNTSSKALGPFPHPPTCLLEQERTHCFSLNFFFLPLASLLARGKLDHYHTQHPQLHSPTPQVRSTAVVQCSTDFE